jgi:hypothetical protein
MKGGAQAALAIGVGYLLGRRRKMRLATMLAIGAAAGGVGPGGAVLRRGAKALGSTQALGKLSPQLGDLAQTVRDDLLDAGKAAAAAAITSKIDSLSNSLHERAETLRNPQAAADGVAETLRPKRRSPQREEGDGEEPEDYAAAGEEPEDYEAGEEPEADEADEEPEDYAAGEEPEDYAAGAEPGPGQAEGPPRRPAARAAGRARSQVPGRTRSPIARPRR